MIKLIVGLILLLFGGAWVIGALWLFGWNHWDGFGCFCLSLPGLFFVFAGGYTLGEAGEQEKETMTKFGFIIDTEQYAGNFERELCAYVTGRIGECGVGEEAAEAFRKETGKEPLEFVELRPTDNACMRPTEIYPTPGWFNHGQGGHFRDGQEEEALNHYRLEVKRYNEEQIKNVKRWNWGKVATEYEIKRRQKEIANANKLKKVNKFSAFLSVAIFCERRPTNEEIEFMKMRANSYNAFRAKSKNGWDRKAIKITGFRLVKSNIDEDVESI